MGLLGLANSSAFSIGCRCVINAPTFSRAAGSLDTMKIKTLLSTLASFLGLPTFVQADPLAVGAPAPEVTAVDQDGKEVNFKEVYAKGPTLVYFYPKADTPGCTKQGCSIRDSWKELQTAGVQVLGVSEDKPEAQKKFKDKYNLPAHADRGQRWQRSPRRFRWTWSRSRTSPSASRFLIKDGKVVWNMLKDTSTETHAADVLKAVAALPK
jgi:peroxiredoxin Q/BCP